MSHWTQGMTSGVKKKQTKKQTQQKEPNSKLKTLNLYKCMMSMSRTTIMACFVFPHLSVMVLVRFYTTHSIYAVLDKTVMTDDLS